MHILTELEKINQSIWLDNIRRDLILTNRFLQLIEENKITGVTSNPSIFEKAILNTTFYEKTIADLCEKDFSLEELFETIIIDDIQRTADILQNVYEKTGGLDGYVSVEISPKLAYDAVKTIDEAERLFIKIGKPNVMIKVPATKEGVHAIHELIKKGINVNATLIFSVEKYVEVANAYINALSYRMNNNLPVDKIFSVASFFVSRIDTQIDAEIDKLIKKCKDAGKKKNLENLKGKSAISNCLCVYEKYIELYSTDIFKKLSQSGARKQKLVWASTSTKNPDYPDTLYVDELALQDTINTLPEQTITAFKNHGTINDNDFGKRLAEAKNHLKKIEKIGINMQKILDELEKDGVQKFVQSYESILNHLKTKKEILLKKNSAEPTCFDSYKSEFLRMKSNLEFTGFVKNLWEKNPFLWKKDEEHIKIIKNSLGWIDLPYKMLSHVKEIETFRDEILKDGFKYAVLLGMGGSSLAPEVMRAMFQKPEFPKLFVLDTTNPDWIGHVEDSIDIKKTLFIFSSKSGSTIEPNSQFKYFWSIFEKNKVQNPGFNFIAITDSGTHLEKMAKEKKFRKIFINPSDIGGRFSALSYFGLVPASICGTNIKILLERAADMANACKTGDIEKNPGILLGLYIAVLWKHGRDKLTLIMPRKMESFGLWIEQLIAESLGKEGKAVIPVCGEELSRVSKYQNDRFFVRTRVSSFEDETSTHKLENLANYNHPVYNINIRDFYDLGSEFYRWEIATSTAGALMHINPFDQPNVQEAKDQTLKILHTLTRTGIRQCGFGVRGKPQYSTNKLAVFVSNAIKKLHSPISGYEDIFWCIFSALKQKEYIAILAYFPPDSNIEQELKNLRENLKNLTCSATMTGYGPRYLHSSGQMHKGGPDNGVFIILTNDCKKDINIAGEKYTFYNLEMAQAIGDFNTLNSKGRRVLRIHFKNPLDRSLKYLNEKISNLEGTNKDLQETNKKGEGTMLKVTNKKTNTTTRTRTKTTTREYVVIDYPTNMETITSRYYSIRIGASPCDRVEISIDDQPWQPCRHSVGYWWYDWMNYTRGTHQIIARIFTRNGEYLISKRRRCKVI